MHHIASLSVVLIMLFVQAQTSPHIARPAVVAAAVSTPTATSMEPSRQETAEFIRNSLLVFSSTDDPHNRYTNVTFDTSGCTMLANKSDGDQYEFFFSNLDADATAWDIFDPNIHGGSRFPKLLRIALLAKPGAISNDALLKGSTAAKHYKLTHLVFSASKVAENPGSQANIEKSLKHLIALCGGKPTSKAF